AEDAPRRRANALVRVEVERAMPESRRKLLLAELRSDHSSEPLSLGAADIYDVDGWLDLTALRELASLPRPELRFPPFHARAPFASTEPLFTLIRQRDLLVHHPYDDFGATVQRFLDEAASDDEVTTIKMTLYRAGERSPVV